MTTLKDTIEKLQEEIEGYEKLFEIMKNKKRELSVLKEAQNIINGKNKPVTTATIRQKPLILTPQNTIHQSSVASDIIAILENAEQTLSPTQLVAELQKMGRDISQNAVCSRLSWLAQRGKVLKEGRGLYRAFGEDPRLSP